MILKKGFIVHHTGEESLLVPAGNVDFSGLVRGNKTFGAVLDLLEKDTTEAEVISAMTDRFDAPEEVIKKDVADILEKLRGIGALDE